MRRQILPQPKGRLVLLIWLSVLFGLCVTASLGLLTPGHETVGSKGEHSRGVQWHLKREAPTQGLATATVWVETNQHRVPIVVELAQTPTERQIGLMFRSELPSGTGMLFQVAAGGRPAVWMKNTWIPLDVAFIGRSGEIRMVREHLVPMSEEIVDCHCPAAAILELPAGTLEELSIGIGTKTEWQPSPEF